MPNETQGGDAQRLHEQDTYPPATRLLPISNALAEAEPRSMQELFGRNPEYLVERDIGDIVLHMRDLRMRLEATATPPKHTKTGTATPRATRLKKVNIEGVDLSGLGIDLV